MRGDEESFGALLRARRTAAGLSIEDLAGRSGVSPRAIGDIERGRIRRPQRRTLDALLDVLAPDGEERDRLAGTAVDAEGSRWCRLPAEPDAFTGRAAVLRALAELDTGGRADGPTPVAVLTGGPGIGKTALALHAAHALTPRYPDGQLFVDLRGMDRRPPGPAEVLHQLLLALGLGERRIPPGTAERAGTFRALLQQRRALVVLDNAADEAQVRPLLPGDGAGLVLLTSRRRLSGLESVHWLPLEPLAPQEAVALLGAVGGRDDDAATAELAAHCGYLPLALRIAGGRLRERPTLPVDALNRRFAAAEHRVAEIDGEGRGLTTALSLSYRQLGPADRRLLRRLGLLPGPDCSADVAAVLAGEERDRIEDRLEALVELGLVSAVPDGRFGLHDLVRSFAVERLAAEEPEARGHVRERLLRWLLRTATAAGRHFEPGGPGAGAEAAGIGGADEAAAWLEAELRNWFPALLSATEEGWDELVMDVVDSLHWFSDRRLHWNVWGEVFGAGATAALHGGDAARQALHLNYRAWAQAVCEHRPDAALASAITARQLAETAGDRVQLAWALLYAATALSGLGRPEQALRYRTEAVEVCRACDDPEALPQALSAMGASLYSLGRAEEALVAHRETLAFARDPQSRMALGSKGPTEALNCRWIGLDLAALDRWEESAAALREGLDGLRALGIRSHEALACVELARSLLRCGRSREAVGHLHRALELADELDDPDLGARATALLTEAGQASDAAKSSRTRST